MEAERGRVAFRICCNNQAGSFQVGRKKNLDYWPEALMAVHFRPNKLRRARLWIFRSAPLCQFQLESVGQMSDIC